MTQREIDEKMYEKKNFIADKFKDIQSISHMLSTPDTLNWEIQIKKRQDAAADALKAGAELKDLESEYPDEEEDTYGTNNAFNSGYSFNQ